ncbi:MAG: hypothetical protein ACREBQ_04655 [Nitrososphaerales archaeon]
MSYNMRADLCVCNVCDHRHATTCHKIKCNCCMASERDRLIAYVNDAMLD